MKPDIENLITQLTLEEKVEMLHAKHMFESAGVERLGIADMKYTDGPFGIREELQPNSWTPLGLENDKRFLVFHRYFRCPLAQFLGNKRSVENSTMALL